MPPKHFNKSKDIEIPSNQTVINSFYYANEKPLSLKVSESEEITRFNKEKSIIESLTSHYSRKRYVHQTTNSESNKQQKQLQGKSDCGYNNQREQIKRTEDEYEDEIEDFDSQIKSQNSENSLFSPSKSIVASDLTEPTTIISVTGSNVQHGNSNRSGSKIPTIETQRQRIQQIQNFDKINNTNHANSFSATKNGIYCDACTLHLKDCSYVFRIDKNSNTINSQCHVMSQGHITSLQQNRTLKIRQPTLEKLVSDILPGVETKIKEFRLELVKLFLTFGVSMANTNNEDLKLFVTKYIGASSRYLSDRSNLSKDFIPKVYELHDNETFNALNNEYFSIQVDSTARIGEWYGFIFRTIDDDLVIRNRPVLKRLQGKLVEVNGRNQLSSLIKSVIRETFRLGDRLPSTLTEKFVSITADRASLNRCAFMGENIKLDFPNLQFIDCHSHTLSNCGKEIDENCHVQKDFWTLHNNVFARGEGARSTWVDYMGYSMVDHNNTRWFAKRDCKDWVRSRWDDYVGYYDLDAHNNNGIKPDSSIAKMRKLLISDYWPALNLLEFNRSKENLFNIRLELAMVCDGSIEYYKACYNLEGDGPIGPFVYTIISNLHDLLRGHLLETYPSVLSLVNSAILNYNGTEEEKENERLRLTEYVFSRINEGRGYLASHFLRTNANREPTSGDNDFGHLHAMYQGFALTDPEHMRNQYNQNNGNVDAFIGYTRRNLQYLFNLRRISIEHRDNLLGSLGVYIPLFRNFTYGLNVRFHEKLTLFTEFWRGLKSKLPHWFKLVKIAILHHPNSCGSERLFSVLKRVLTTEKECALDDYVKAAVYCRYSTIRDENRVIGEVDLL